MLWLQVILISLFICFVTCNLITKDFETTVLTNEKNNLVNLDIIDDSTIDIHYKTNCEDCKCFVDWSPSTYETITEMSFSNKIIGSFITKDKIHLLHRGASGDTYFSLFLITVDGGLEEISKEQKNENYKELEDLIFSSIEEKYISLTDDSITIFKTDTQGEFKQEKQLSFSLNDEDIKGKVYNAAYLDGFLYLNKGEYGVQVVNIKDDKIQKISLSPSDLELNEGYTITKIEVVSNQTLYAYCTNFEDNLILVLDFSDLDEIKILNRYRLEVKNIIGIFNINGQIAVVENDENKDYFKLFSIPQDQQDTLKLVRHWEIPFEVIHIRRNEETILIEGNDHFYVLKGFFPFEIKKLELVLDALEKESQESFYPIFQERKQFLLSLSESKIALLEVPKKELSYNCGVFKKDYQGVVAVSLYVYNDACSEVQSDDKDNMCLYRYNYTISFTGEEYSNYESTFLLPQELTAHNENYEEIFNYYQSLHPHSDHPDTPQESNQPQDSNTPKEPDQPQDLESQESNQSQDSDIPKESNEPHDPDSTKNSDDSKKPETQNEDETPKQNPNTPNEHHGHDTPNNNPSAPSQQHGHGHGMKTNSDFHHPPTKEQLDEMEQRRNYGRYKNYIMAIFAFIFLILIGCFLKYLFKRSKPEEFSHEELQEIENDETEDIEN